jgi:uncharacterized membrane protein YqjE
VQQTGEGLAGAARRLAAKGVSIVATRLELLANELEEERLRITQMLVYLLFALFCFGMALLLATLFIVVLFWESHRLVVLGGLTLFFVALGLLLAMMLKGLAQQRSPLFSASLAEFNRDKAELERHEQPNE